MANIWENHQGWILVVEGGGGVSEEGRLELEGGILWSVPAHGRRWEWMIFEPKSFCDPGKTGPTLSSLGASKAKCARKTLNLSGLILLIPHGIRNKSKLLPAGFSFPKTQGGKQQITFSSGGWTHLREGESLGVSKEFEKLTSGKEGAKNSRRGRNSMEILILNLCLQLSHEEIMERPSLGKKK